MAGISCAASPVHRYKNSKNIAAMYISLHNFLDIDRSADQPQGCGDEVGFMER